MFRKALPDLHYTIDEMIAEGDTVAVRYTMTGTFTGDLMGIPPTGKSVKLTSAFFYHFINGKEEEALPFSDMLSFYLQLGIPIQPSQ